MIPRFKAYDKKRNILFLPEVIDLFMDLEGNVYRDIFDEAQQGVGLKLLDKNRIILVQSTGLKDVNEKEVFEGDIIERTSMTPGGINFTGVVKFYECAFWIANEKDAVPLFTEIDKLEVKGNIYENEELIL